jgi:hypothetical protein
MQAQVTVTVTTKTSSSSSNSDESKRCEKKSPQMNQIPNFQTQNTSQLTMSSQANSTIPKMLKHTKLLSETQQNLPKSFNKTKHKTHFTFKKQNFNTNKTKKHYQKTLNSKILHLYIKQNSQKRT